MTETTKPTESLEEKAERLTVLALRNETFAPCFATVTMIVRAKEGGFKHRNKKMTQVEKLLNHFRTVGHISQREAYLEYNIQSFHRRLSDLKELGYVIRGYAKTNPVTGQSYSRYYMESLV